MNEALSVYAFREYKRDAELYNGIAEQEQTIARLRKELAEAKASVSREFLHRSIAESRNIGWDSIQSLGWLELKRERDRALSELAGIRKAVAPESRFDQVPLVDLVSDLSQALTEHVSELAAAQQLLKELHEFNECALCYDDGDCKFADAIDAARGAEAGALRAQPETQGGKSDAE